MSKGKTRHRRRAGSDDDTLSMSPTTSRSLEAPLPDIQVGGPPENSTHVYFKDMIVAASDDSEEESEPSERGTTNSSNEARAPRKVRRRNRVDRQKLIIILVGLPGRGKTFLCNKLMCYLNWLGHDTRHFNVGQYRRVQKGTDEVQDASFFDPSNEAGLKARHQALMAALEDMDTWLGEESAQVAIFDATNSTEQRRQLLRNRFHGKWQYLFIESICNDPDVLEQNYRYKMMYSPDYKQTEADLALADFRQRIQKYEEVYETITDRNLHYIKLIDMVTGRGYMDVNRISGYIPGKMVFFLMQVCKAGVARMRKIWLTRHGESEYNERALLGGDSNISPAGQIYARLLPDVIVDRIPLTLEGATMPVSVWTSTLRRTIQTAELLPFPKLRWKALDEIQAGIFDGWTYEEIAEKHPEEYAARKRDKLRYRYPSGESYMDVIQRLEPVIIEIERERECVVVVAHQAILRALYGYFMKIPLSDVPRLEIPLHTLIELVPTPDGRMAEERIPFNIRKSMDVPTRLHMEKQFSEMITLSVNREQA
ncbi:6-phosphofructo-2-kinase/fructose-2,6-bisphosphatase 4 [Coccomyxa sp. Obi]|nr:6-phosphofructo-2-kinase/fructose-2,6-bisphosphatase 4 [Coccomyxa sp. Obi]